MFKEFSLQEVAECNGKDGTSIWIIIKDNVYDVTTYLEKHPGGRELLMEYAGKDATKAFNETGHSSDATGILKTFKIGEIIKEDKRKNRSKSVISNNDSAIVNKIQREKRKMKLFFCI